MGADLSRIRSNPLLDFSGVELKQGGVLLDADFNELVALVDRRLRATASDILGRSTVSSATPDAFKITAGAAGALAIGKGRLYVDGLLAENHGAASEAAADAAKKLFDRLMAEVQFADPIAYGTQPYLPSPPALPEGGRHLVYLDVWEREVTHLERPGLVEPAVGVETSSRLQIVWQVRVLQPDAGSAGCGSPDSEVAGWEALTAASTGRLTTGTFEMPPADDPCELPPTGGYRGLENQTYRVEIHDPGQPGGKATFKWSRDNASVGSRVASVISSAELELQTLGRDDVLRFNSGDWVEIIDDVRELSQRSGEIRQITVAESSRRITFTSALPDEMVPSPLPGAAFFRERNLRVRRWDQNRKVLRTMAAGATSVFQDLEAAGSTGVISVPASGTTLLLENGVTVSFTATVPQGLRAGDFWVFAARTADASVELLANEPPRGIHHHYARLGLWDVAAGTVTDCRTPWPPRGEGHDCSCTECVTPESHASGKLTIQAAVDRVRDTGGTVCLGAGQFQLKEPVLLKGARSVRIRGQGAATLVITPGGAFSINSGVALAIEDLAVLSVGTASAITVRSALGLTLQRLIVAVLGGNDGRSAAITLAGAIVGATVRDNLLIAPVAVLANEGRANLGVVNQRGTFMLSALLRIEDNVMWCERQGISLAGLSVHLMATRITGNEIFGCQQGALELLGLAAPGASMQVRANSLNVGGPGITAGVDGLWICDNKLFASTQSANKPLSGAGIRLRTGLDPNGANECQVLSNQVTGFEDGGVLIESPVRELVLKLNTIQRCGNGIVTQGDVKGASVSIENNHLSDIGNARDGAREVVGIAVLNAESATVAGNTVRRIGLQAKQAVLRAGIVCTAGQRLRVAGNDVMDIGPPGNFDGGFAVGVLLRAPYAQASVGDNQIDRESVPQFEGGGRFIALWADEPDGQRLVSRIGVLSTVRIDANTTLTLGAGRPIVGRTAAGNDPAGAAAVPLGSNVSILGNAFGARGDLPAVQVLASGDCQFTNNRCELRGKGAKFAVDLASSATIVSSNRVRGAETSIKIGGNTKNATVLGNITTGIIDLGGPLGAPWTPFNLRG